MPLKLHNPEIFYKATIGKPS